MNAIQPIAKRTFSWGPKNPWPCILLLGAGAAGYSILQYMRKKDREYWIAEERRFQKALNDLQEFERTMKRIEVELKAKGVDVDGFKATVIRELEEKDKK
jgi:hypothetical protein